MTHDRMADRERILRLSKEGLWVVFGQAVAVLGSMLGVRVLTGLLDPAQYGELALGLTFAALVNQTVLGPIANGITRFYAPAQERQDLGGYLHAVRWMVLAASAVVLAGALLVVIALLLAGKTQAIEIALMSLAFATATGHNGILNGIQNAARQRSIAALHQGLEPWARLVVAASFLVILAPTSTVAMLGFTIGVVLVLGSQYLFFQRTIQFGASANEQVQEWFRNIWRYAWPFGAWGIFSWAQQASDRWALELFASTREVGLYSALFQLGYYPMTMASGMMAQFLGPIFYQRAGDATDARRNQDVTRLSRRLAAVILAATAAVFGIAFLLHEQIFFLLVAPEYTGVSYLLPWMLLSGGIFAAGQTIALDLMSQMRTRSMATAKIVTSSIGIALNFVGAYLFGTKGIVVAIVLFSVLYSVWLMLLSRQTTTGPNTQQVPLK